MCLQLSGGQAKRVALAAALLGQPGALKHATCSHVLPTQLTHATCSHVLPTQLTGTALARLAHLHPSSLFTWPDLLVLDEPTNHMDVDIISWMEKELRMKEMALVVVSHDRWGGRGGQEGEQSSVNTPTACCLPPSHYRPLPPPPPPLCRVFMENVCDRMPAPPVPLQGVHGKCV